jgi:Ca2+-binding EF-hand superfamily protein
VSKDLRTYFGFISSVYIEFDHWLIIIKNLENLTSMNIADIRKTDTNVSGLKEREEVQYINTIKILGSQVSETQKEIKIICEVEKIWIVNDLNENGTLELAEIYDYLKEMVVPFDYSEDSVRNLFQNIDVNNDHCISKKEMMKFLSVMMQ